MNDFEKPKEPYNFKTEFDKLIQSRVNSGKDVGNRFRAFTDDQLQNKVNAFNFLDIFAAGMGSDRNLVEFVRTQSTLIIERLESIPEDILLDGSETYLRESIAILKDAIERVKEFKEGEEMEPGTAGEIAESVFRIQGLLNQLKSEYRGGVA